MGGGVMKILYARSAQEAVMLHAGRVGVEFKAGGTDVVDRMKTCALAPLELVNLLHVPLGNNLEERDGELILGARVTLEDVATHPLVRTHFPVLQQAADHSATPQIRRMATVAGALCQRPRCVYLRHPNFLCRKEGGSECFALGGDHTTHGIFDNTACAAVHPSTLGAALLALDAVLDVRTSGETATTVSAAQFFAVQVDDPLVENTLPGGALIEAIRVPISRMTTHQGYQRASARLLADWADVEVAVVLGLDGAQITQARVVLGAVGPVPRRALRTEEALLGQTPSTALMERAAGLAADGARPLAHNTYKVPLVVGTTRAALEAAFP
jgi:xanthine dehydrogenase YagS FAD-binding subunit